MDTETFVSLTIISAKHLPEDIDHLLGLNCERSWKIGDLRSKTTIKEKDNGWVLTSGLDNNRSISEHIEELLKKIGTSSDAVLNLSHESYVEISCAIYTNELPSLHFEKSTIHRINKLGASLDIDIYMIH